MADERDTKKEYSNGEITIVWQPALCIHSTMCWKHSTGLPEVFNPRARPWVNPKGAASDKIKRHIDQCPSGALSYYVNNEKPTTQHTMDETLIVAKPNGPLLVHGDVLVKDAVGNEIKKSNITAFCRCGHSQNKPFCDGSHAKNDFKG